MKTAIYIENGTTQLVLTPENDWEKQVLVSIAKEPRPAIILRGEFYDCQGGWIRQRPDGYESLMIRLDNTNTTPNP